MPVAPVGDVEIAYEVVGSGPPLLLISGLGSDRGAWRYQLDEYGRHFSCIALDNRGTGASGKPPGPYTTEQMARDAVAVLDHLGIERAHAAGQSMGGAIVQMLAVNHPDRLLSASVHCSWPRCDGFLRAIFEGWSEVRGAAPAPAYNRSILPWILSCTTFECDPAFVERQLEEMGSGESQPLEAYRAQISACISHDASGSLAGCRVSMLVTVGADDVFTRPRYSAQIADAVPGARLEVLENAGHCLFWEQAAGFNELTSDFMWRHSPEGGRAARRGRGG